MIINIVFILLGILYSVVTYFIGIKRNLIFASFFIFGFTEDLVENS